MRKRPDSMTVGGRPQPDIRRYLLNSTTMSQSRTFANIDAQQQI